MAVAQSVEVIEPPTRAGFERYVRARTPVVIRGAVADWPAVGRWTEAYFRAERTPRRLPVEVHPRGFFARAGWLGRVPKRELSVAEYLDLPAGGPTQYYAPDLELEAFFPDLESDVHVPRFLAHPHRRFLFMGEDKITALHFHAYRHALTCQVTGEKEIVLHSPADTKYLYTHPWYAPAASWSSVDFSDPDPVEYPALAHARPLHARLRPGDALFIPVHWWHWVRGFGFAASLLLSWRASLREWHYPGTALRSAWSAVFWEPARVASTFVRGKLRRSARRSRNADRREQTHGPRSRDARGRWPE